MNESNPIPTPQPQHDESVLVTTDGEIRRFDRLWISKKTGYVNGTIERVNVVERYPPQKVAAIVEPLDNGGVE